MALKDELIKLNIDTVEKEPMDRHTSFRVGGPAALFARPADADELKTCMRLAEKSGVATFILGRGSNLLVTDAGFNGLMISTDGLNECRFEGMDIYCGAGVSVTALAAEAGRRGLSGLEFAYGIPGSIGGAVFMNAGAYGGEIKDVLVSVTLLKNGEVVSVPASELELSYRHSNIEETGAVVLSAHLRLNAGDAAQISALMEKNMAARREKQPLEYPSAGSTFKRPEGYFAGKLIADAGLKGFTVGGARVSEKHAGFVINAGDATTSDILRLMAEVEKKVYEQTGVRLEPEVRVVGD